MKSPLRILLFALLLTAASVAQVRIKPEIAPDYPGLAAKTTAQIEGAVAVSGLQNEVLVLRDTWGIPHIYARNAHDLFMAQGFAAAQDRLWQMEMWRRTGEGTLSELIGPAAIPRDRFARLMRYRGNMSAEWESYSPDARAIVESFVAGVNASIASRKGNLPFEFQIAEIAPRPWTPEVCLTRMAGYVMTRNATSEIFRAQVVHQFGAELAERFFPPNPFIKIEVPRGLDLAGIDGSILGAATAAGGAVSFRRDEGSNNWTVSGRLTYSGKPILANDPHRPITLPSLRYISHLNAPGWNVIGAGEPGLPGIAAGHNERIAFGFTIVGIDQQDIYVEELNPANPLEYRYGSSWKTMTVIREELPVKGRPTPEILDLHFTLHGPVIHEDRTRNRAYALRWVGSEPGSAGYLASLSLDRARNWNEFLKALERWKVPSENLVYADVEGNVGWQAAGLSPVRRGWSGLLPVPGTGAYEWQGFLPFSEMPRKYNPASGFIATANHNILPTGYRHALGYEWSSDWRFRRIEEVLGSRKRFTIEDFQRLQHDETSLPAQRIVPLLRGIKNPPEDIRETMDRLSKWDFVLEQKSTEAAIFETWMQKLVPMVWRATIPVDAQQLIGGRASQDLVISWLEKPSKQEFGESPVTRRDQILVDALVATLQELRSRFGPEKLAWSWGSLHQAFFQHPLGKDAILRSFLDRGPVRRGGDSTTVNATSGPNFRQASGASYRQIMDLADWDRSVGVNVPGESGEPGSPHYDDLLALWSSGKYHPLAFSREMVEKVTRHRLVLKPGAR